MASEVKSLAEQTGEIGAQVCDIQSATSESVISKEIGAAAIEE